MTSVIVEPIHRLAIGPRDEVAVGIHVDPGEWWPIRSFT